MLADVGIESRAQEEDGLLAVDAVEPLKSVVNSIIKTRLPISDYHSGRSRPRRTTSNRRRWITRELAAVGRHYFSRGLSDHSPAGAAHSFRRPFLAPEPSKFEPSERHP